MKAQSWHDYFFLGVQLVLFAAFLFDPAWADFPRPPVLGLQIGAGVLMGLGGLIGLAAVWELRKSGVLRAYPSPAKHSKLIRSGIYGHLRHPIYTGIFLFLFGYGWWAGSWWKIWTAFVLLVLFYFKAQHEEKLLQKKFPDYKNYQQQTRMLF